jgi:hypothetical protein
VHFVPSIEFSYAMSLEFLGPLFEGTAGKNIILQAKWGLLYSLLDTRGGTGPLLGIVDGAELGAVDRAESSRTTDSVSAVQTNSSCAANRG